MQGHEHYREAERLLTQAVDWPAQLAAQAVDAITTGQPWQGPDTAEINAAIASSITMAQVHATLALASKQDAKPETAQVTRALVYRQWTDDWNLTTNWAGTRYITVDYPNGNRVTATVTIDDVEVTRAGHH